MHYISFLSTVVTFGFTWAVYRRYRLRGGSHLLFWAVGLLLYGLGTLTEVVLGFTFSGVALKVWYLTGAMLTAAWLGQGTVHLLVRKRGVARALTWVLAAVSLVALWLVLRAPLTAAVAHYDPTVPVSTQYKAVMERNGLMIALTILLNIYGTITLVGGALYSAFLFWRKQVLFNRMIGNILIAAGALSPAIGGTFVKAGMADWLYVSEFVGVLLMYAGFIQAVKGKVAAAQPAAAD